MSGKIAYIMIGLVLAICLQHVAAGAGGCKENGNCNYNDNENDIGTRDSGVILVDLYGMGNFHTIQAAVENAGPGDTILVSEGLYLENVVIDRTVTLRGTGRTRIDGDLGTGILVRADHVNVSGFEVFSAETGMLLENCKGCEIYNNTLSDNFHCGIRLSDVRDSVIRDNQCRSNGGRCGHDDGYGGYGLLLWDSHGNEVRNNHCCANEWFEKGEDGRQKPLYATGIGMVNSDHNTLEDNVVTNNSGYGMNLVGDFNRIIRNTVRSNYFSYYDVFDSTYLYSTGTVFHGNFNLILGNEIANNFEGIKLVGCKNLILNNTCKEHKVADISLEAGSHDNTIAYNTFHIYRQRPIMVYDNSSYNNNIWNLPYSGNYWSDYAEKYPDASNDSRVWNMSYEILGSADNYDHFPLCRPLGIENATPTASAGSVITTGQHRYVGFNGLGSESCYTIINYTWNFRYQGKQYRIYGARPGFMFHEVGDYRISLTVENLLGETDSDLVIVSVKDTDPPLADAGPDMVIPNDRPFVLDASKSFDNVGITYFDWSFNYDDERHVYNAENQECFFSIPGKYRIKLLVRDAMGNEGQDDIFITVVTDNRPMARAGQDLFITEGDTAMLNAADSFDDIGIVNYTWNLVYAGEPVALYGAENSFTFDAAGMYPITLNVTDSGGKWDLDRLFVSVRPMPIFHAHAGHNRTVDVGEPVYFNGSVTGELASIPEYVWKLEYGGNCIVLSGYNATFNFDTAGNYTVTLIVRDAKGNWAGDVIWVNVTGDDEPPAVISTPVADAGQDVTVDTGQYVLLDGSGSSDAVGIESFQWTFVYEGNRISLGGSSPTYVFTTPGEYYITLTVTNLDGQTHRDTVKVTVTGAQPTEINVSTEDVTGDNLSRPLPANLPYEQDGKKNDTGTEGQDETNGKRTKGETEGIGLEDDGTKYGHIWLPVLAVIAASGILLLGAFVVRMRKWSARVNEKRNLRIESVREISTGKDRKDRKTSGNGHTKRPMGRRVRIRRKRVRV